MERARGGKATCSLAPYTAGVVPICVVATAGTTVLGAYDPLADVRRICDEKGAWMHVDGCWGASAMLSDRHRHLTACIGEFPLQ